MKATLIRLSLIAIGLAISGSAALSQVTPCPDTAVTGNPTQDVDKLARAWSDPANVEKEIAEFPKKFDALKPMLTTIERKEIDGAPP